MNRSIPIAAALLVVFAACRQEDDLFDADADAIVVEVFSKNDVTGAGSEEPVPKDQEVFISSGSNTAEYLFKAKTDDNGRCSFEHLPSGEYTVWASRTVPGANDVPALLLKKSDTSGSRTRRLVLEAGAAQTGFVLRCLTPGGEPLNGLKVCPLSTAQAAAIGCQPSAFPEMTTDAQGRVSKWGIGAGTFYMRITSATGTLLRVDTVTVNTGTLTYDTARITLPVVTGLELRCHDAANVGVTGLTIHGYPTQALAAAGNTTLASFEVLSTGNGVYRKEGIVPQAYWLRVLNAVQQVDQTIPVTVPAGPIVPTEVLIVPVPLTGYVLFCNDGSSSGIPGLTVHGYATQALADSSFTQSASFQMPAIDTYGHYRVVGIPAGDYWLGIQNVQLDIDTFRPITVIAGTVYEDTFDVIP
jgi:hypothetical protein